MSKFCLFIYCHNSNGSFLVILLRPVEVKIGKEVAVNKEKILELIDKFPFKKPHLKKEKI